MLRRLRSRIALVQPPAGLVVTFIVLFAVFEGAVLYYEWKLGARVDIPFRPGRIVLIFGSAVLGIRRVTAFHPYYQADYLHWLFMTPWTVDKRLPVGPVELGPEDSLAVGCLMLLSLTQPEPRSIELVNVFLFSNLVALVATFWGTRVETFGYCAGLCLGFVPQFWDRPWLDLAILSAIYLFAYQGLWLALARFRWWGHSIRDDINWKSRDEKMYGPLCGWPHDRFLRDAAATKQQRIRTIDAVLIALLTGWWVYSLESWIVNPGFPVLVLMYAAFPLLVVRRQLYFQGYAPPISLSGRFATFRWFIPGYDQALFGLLAPIVMVPVVIVAGQSLGVGFAHSIPVAIAVLVFLVLSMPPSLRKWRLTGQHRLTPGMGQAGANFVKVG
jgi:hypothetical protein